MSRRVALALAFAFAAVTARADFDSLVRAVESTHGLHRVWTPGISLVRLGIRMVHPDGVHDLQLAVFEGDGRVDLGAVTRSTHAVPMIRTHDNRTGETVVVWGQPVGNDLMELLVVSHDPKDDTVVVRVVVDGEALAREISDPKHASDIASR